MVVVIPRMRSYSEAYLNGAAFNLQGSMEKVVLVAVASLGCCNTGIVWLVKSRCGRCLPWSTVTGGLLIKRSGCREND